MQSHLKKSFQELKEEEIMDHSSKTNVYRSHCCRRTYINAGHSTMQHEETPPKIERGRDHTL
eukprot:8372311-Ditylum_brightwellii.AAC.1